MTVSYLLSTKFLVPRRGQDHLARPHLVGRLAHAVAERRLTLLSAPPGYGKTTLLVELVDQGALPCAWLQLDAADGDPRVFLSSLVESVRRLGNGGTLPAYPLGSEMQALLESSGDSDAISPERILGGLINELAENLRFPWLLVLEDYHLITNPAVHGLTDLLIEHGPPHMHLIISSRVDPPLAIARQRGRGQLEEVRVPDLRFSPQEIRARLATTARTPILSEESIAALHEKTEGWAAAVQIVASALAGADEQGARRYVERLSGVQRHIFAYLAEEVFRRHPAARQDFLMRTAVLVQMDAVICNALLGVDNAQDLLEELEAENLFLVSLDEERAWYRYHHLFREFLLARLARELPAQRPGLELAAARYYEAQGELEAAFGHFLRGKDVDAACRVLTALAPEYLERGRTAVLQRYLAELPAAALRKWPELMLNAGIVLHRLGQLAPAIARYEEARRAFAAQDDAQGVCRALTQLAEVARAQGDYGRAQTLASEALTNAAADDYAGRAHALMALARSEGFLTDMGRGRALAEEAVAAARLAGDAIAPRTRAQLLRALGHICWWYGDPGATVRFCQEALHSIADAPSPISANAYITMATPYVYWGDLATALTCAQRGLEMVQQMDLAELLPRACATLGAVLGKRGELVEGEALLRRAIDLATASGVDTYAQVIATGYLASNLMAQQRNEEARQVAETTLWTQGSDPHTYEMIFCRSILADIALSEGHLDEAETIFGNLAVAAERRHFRLPLAMIYFGLAYLRLVQGRTNEGLELAHKSLAIVEEAGTVQLYVDQGDQARTVCQALAAAGTRTHFVLATLERLGTAADVPGVVDLLAPDAAPVVIHCLGRMRVFVSGAEVQAEEWVSIKARDLLAYFAHFRHARVGLEMALADLWPDDEQTGKNAFHSALYRLRQVLRRSDVAGALVKVKGGDYWLDPGLLVVDVDRFDQALAQARTLPRAEATPMLEAALRLYQGEYLGNLRYCDWAAVERHRLQEAYTGTLRTLTLHYLDQRCYAEALDRAQRAVQGDPYQEESHLLAMRCYAALGDRRGLMRQYAALTAALCDELDVPLMPQTDALYQALLQQVQSA